MKVSLSHNIVLCLNFLMKNYSKQNLVVVVDLDLKTDFPSVRINFGGIENLDSLPQIPSAYVVSLDQIGERELTHVLKKFGHSISTKYVFIGHSWRSPFNPNFSSEYFRNVIFINTENSDINQVLDGNYVVPKKTKNSFENCSGVTFEKMKFDLEKRTPKICFLGNPPYIMREWDKKRGIEKEIFGNIMSSLKAEEKFISVRLNGGYLAQFIEEVLNNGTCDVFSGMYPIPGNLDITRLMFMDSMIWVVKSAEEIPRWRYAFDVFSPQTWLLWVFSAVCLSVAKHIIAVVTKQNGGLKDGLIVFTKFFLEQPQTLKSQVSAGIILLATFLFATFLMNVYYKSNFMFLLTGTKYDVNVNSLEDAMTNGYTLRCSRTALQYFHDPKELEYLKDHYEEKTLHLQQLGKKTAQLMNEKIFSYTFSDFLDKNYRASVRKLEKPLINLPFGALLKKGEHLTGVLNEKLDRLAENGVLTWIFSKYSNEVKEENGVGVRELSLNSIQLPILLWFIGITISLLVFLYEVKINTLYNR